MEEMPLPIQVILMLYFGASALTVAAYGLDKRRALRQRRRISERSLHLLELLGGWPGGLIGQMLFRHKRRKLRYMAVFWLIVLLHLAGWTWYWISSG
jgi:uncharacterized membrane protein YsdA (DUF1294 family)